MLIVKWWSSGWIPLCCFWRCPSNHCSLLLLPRSDLSAAKNLALRMGSRPSGWNRGNQKVQQRLFALWSDPGRAGWASRRYQRLLFWWERLVGMFGTLEEYKYPNIQSFAWRFWQVGATSGGTLQWHQVSFNCLVWNSPGVTYFLKVLWGLLYVSPSSSNFLPRFPGIPWEFPTGVESLPARIRNFPWDLPWDLPCKACLKSWISQSRQMACHRNRPWRKVFLRTCHGGIIKCGIWSDITWWVPRHFHAFFARTCAVGFWSVGSVEQKNSNATERTQHDLNSVGFLRPVKTT